MRPKSKDRTADRAGAARNERPERLDWSKLPDEVRIMLEMQTERLVDEILCVAVRPGTKIRLGLLKYERDLLLNCGAVSMGLTEQQIAGLKSAQNPELSMTLGDWDVFHGYVAAEANHCTDKRTKARLDKLVASIDEILRRHKESRTREPGSHWVKSSLFPK